MRVFITGATGFVGRHVISEIHESGHDLLASRLQEDKKESYSSNIQWLYGDFSDFESFKQSLISFNPDVVIHLAWQGIPDYSELISTINLNNSIDLLDCIMDNTNCRKILVSGSCWEYGKDQGACKESDPANINSYFTWAKNSLNQYLQIKCAQKNIILNWFRLFYMYGSGQREESLIPTVIKSISAKETPRINTPHNKNDFIYVIDAAKAFAKAVDADFPSGVYNLGSGYATSGYDICRIVEKELLGTKSISKQVIENGQQTETVNFWADMTKTKKALSMQSVTPLKEGLELHIKSIQTAALA